MNETQTNSPVPENEQNMVLQSWLAEYQSLKGEISNIDRVGNTLVSVNIVAAGIILSIWKIAPDPSFYFLLFLTMSLVSSCLGLICVAGRRHIIKISNHIRNNITPSIRKISNNEEIFKWEEGVRSPFRFLDLLTGTQREPLILTVMFFAPSAISLSIALYQMFSRNLWSSWFYIAFLIATVILIVMLSLNGWKWFHEWPLEKRNNG